jgi:hypothetical protein
MNITDFQSLLEAARQQTEQQRLLLVFTRAELPDDATAEQRAGFEQGEGGALVPVMYVDKEPEEVRTFEELVEESRHTGQHWDMMFVGCLSGQGGRGLDDNTVQKALETMIMSIQGGIVAHLLAYRPNGEQVQLAGAVEGLN